MTLKGTPQEERDVKWHRKHFHKMRHRVNLAKAHLKRNKFIQTIPQQVDSSPVPTAWEVVKQDTWWRRIINKIKKLWQ